MLALVSYSQCGRTHVKNDDHAVLGQHVLTGAEKPETNASDCLFVADKDCCFAVFDGVGGSSRGDYASEAACAYIAEHQANLHDATSLEIMLQECTRRVFSAQEELEELQNALTVGVGSYVSFSQNAEETSAHWYSFHAGDCRAYCFRDNSIELLTKDDSMAQRLKDELGPDFEVPPQIAHTVTKYLGDSPENPFTISEAHELMANDVILLCSDGFWEYVETEFVTTELSNVLEASKEWYPTTNQAAFESKLADALKATAQTLAHHAFDNNSPDDITIALCFYLNDGGTSSTEATPNEGDFAF